MRLNIEFNIPGSTFLLTSAIILKLQIDSNGSFRTKNIYSHCMNFKEKSCFMVKKAMITAFTQWKLSNSLIFKQLLWELKISGHLWKRLNNRLTLMKLSYHLWKCLNMSKNPWKLLFQLSKISNILKTSKNKWRLSLSPKSLPSMFRQFSIDDHLLRKLRIRSLYSRKTQKCEKAKSMLKNRINTSPGSEGMMSKRVGTYQGSTKASPLWNLGALPWIRELRWATPCSSTTPMSLKQSRKAFPLFSTKGEWQQILKPGNA